MISIVIFFGCILILYVLLQGAPYVPTRKKDIEIALDLMKLPEGALVIDIGAGDGAVLRAVAERSHRAIGIEIHPLMWLIARMRTRRYTNKVQVVFGNVWHWELPPETTGIFIFTAGPFAKRMATWLRNESRRLKKPLTVVSFGFSLPDETAVENAGACIKYVIQ